MLYRWLYVAAALGGSIAVAAEETTIVAYNIWEAFNEKSATVEGIAWVREQNPDVVALQELVNVDAEELAAMAAGWGHAHSAILKENGYPVGITSKSEIEVVERRLRRMWHGYLHARTAGFDFFVVHLAPGSQQLEVRKREAVVLDEAIRPVLASDAPVVVLGDFNDLNPLDYAPGEGNLEAAGEKDFGVLQAFLDLGLVDTARLAAEAEGRSPRGTFPTRIFTPERSAEDHEPNTRRIDFVFVSPNLETRIFHVESPRDPVLDRTSDHYPVVLKLTQ